MIMRSAKVPLSPSSALQTMYFCGRPSRIEHGLPLDAGREAGAAAAAQAGFFTSSTISAGSSARRASRPFVAAMRAIIVERARIDDAAAREGQPRLPLQERDLLGRAERRGMMRRRRGSRRRTGRRRRPARPARRRCGPAASRPRPSAPASRGRASRCGRSRPSSPRSHREPLELAPRPRRRRPRPRRHRSGTKTRASSPHLRDDAVGAVASSSRPTSRPSSIAEGAVAQRPRQ